MAYRDLSSITVSDIQALGISPQVSDQLHASLTKIIQNFGAATPETWRQIYTRLLNPDLPFLFHQMLYYGCYTGFGPDPPAWIPDQETATSTNVAQLLKRKGKEFLSSKYKDPMSSFSDFQQFSVSNPEVYWRTVFDEMNIAFSIPPQRILHENPSQEGHFSSPGGQWLSGAIFNAANLCLSNDVKWDLDATAVIWRDEGDDDLSLNRVTIGELRAEVWLVAHAIKDLGFETGSAIAIDMPMSVKAVVIYLAIVLAGHVVVSIADSFAAREISSRLKISKAKSIFTQDFIIRGDKSIPLYSRVVEAQSPVAIVIPAKKSSFTMKMRDGDITWHDFLERVKDLKGSEFSAIEQPAESFTNILFSSGTTVGLQRENTICAFCISPSSLHELCSAATLSIEVSPKAAHLLDLSLASTTN